MRVPALLLTLALLPLAGTVAAQPHYERPVHIITSDYDLVDTTYIDRGRLDGVRVGDHFRVEFPDGKLVTDVVVTGVFERMAAVKIVDSWFLKNGQIAGYNQRPMVVPLEAVARREAPAELARRRRRRHEERLAMASHAPAAPAVGAQTGPQPAASAGPQALPVAPSKAAAPGNAPGPDSSLPTPPGGASDSALTAPRGGSGAASASAASPGTPAPSGGASDANQNIPPPPE